VLPAGCARSVFHYKAYFPFRAFPALLLPFHVYCKGQPISGTCFKFAQSAGGGERSAVAVPGLAAFFFLLFLWMKGMQDPTKASRPTWNRRKQPFLGRKSPKAQSAHVVTPPAVASRSPFPSLGCWGCISLVLPPSPGRMLASASPTLSAEPRGQHASDPPHPASLALFPAPCPVSSPRQGPYLACQPLPPLAGI